MLFFYFLILFSIERGGTLLLNADSGFLGRAGPPTSISSPVDSNGVDSTATLVRYLIAVSEQARADYEAVLSNATFTDDISNTNWIYAITPDTATTPTTIAQMRNYPTFVAAVTLHQGAPILVVYPETATAQKYFINKNPQFLSSLFAQNANPHDNYFLFDNSTDKIYPLNPEAQEIDLPFDTTKANLPGSRTKWASITNYNQVGRKVADGKTITGESADVDIYRDGAAATTPNGLATSMPISISYIPGF